MTVKRLTSSLSVKEYFENLIENSKKSALYNKALQEKEKQQATTDSLFSDSSSNDSPEEQDSQSSKTVDDEAEKLKTGEVKAEDIVEKLNSIRAGKSFKDSAVKNSMTEYIGSLNKAEKTAMLTFLKAIAQIVSGEFSGEDAIDPGDPPPNVQMQKEPSSKKRSIEPNVIKTSKQPENKATSKKSSEDTSPPIPITPKRK